MRQERKCSNCGTVLPAAKYMCARCGHGSHNQSSGVEIMPGLFVVAGGAHHKPIKDTDGKVKPSPASAFKPYGACANPYRDEP